MRTFGKILNNKAEMDSWKHIQDKKVFKCVWYLIRFILIILKKTIFLKPLDLYICNIYIQLFYIYYIYYTSKILHEEY